MNDNNAAVAAPMKPDSQEGRVTALAPADQPASPTEPPESVPIVSVPAPPDQDPVLIYLAGIPASSGRRGLQHSLARAAEILTGGLTKSALIVDWAAVRYQHVAALRAALIDDGVKPATINHILSAVRGTMREAMRLELVDAETLARVIDVNNVSTSVLPFGRHVSTGEISRLFKTCGDSSIGARDAAMIALLYGCGVRRSEVVAIELADYDDGAVAIRQGKVRNVYCPAGGKEAVDDWIERRGAWPGALLCPVKKGGYVQQSGMTDQAVMLRLRYLSRRARVSHFAPQDLRRSYVSELLDAGADIASVQQLAGYATDSTQCSEEYKRRIAEMLYVPYFRK